MSEEGWFIVAASVGAWLLFAGPVYQASVELRAQESIRDGVAKVVGSVPLHRRVSGWWWLVPPVAIVLQHRLTREFQHYLFGVLSSEQTSEWLRLREKAMGWWLVATGALLIAVHETSRLVEHANLPAWVVAPVTIVCVAAAIGYTARRLAWTRRTALEAAAARSTSDASGGSRWRGEVGPVSEN